MHREVRAGIAGVALLMQSAPSPSLTPLALTHKGEALNSMFVNSVGIIYALVVITMVCRKKGKC